MLIAQHIIQKCSFLSNVQRRLLLLVIQAIYCCRSRINFASMGRTELLNEKTIRRYFNTPTDFIEVHRAVVDTVLPAEVSGLRVIGFDPSFLQKSGTKTHGLSKFWNGSAQRAENGLEVSIAVVIDVERRIALPLSIAQTCPPGMLRAEKPPLELPMKALVELPLKPLMELPVEICASSNQDSVVSPSQTKIAEKGKKESWLVEEYLRHIGSIVPHLTGREKHLVMDSYFAKTKVFDQCVVWNLFCITKLRSDANMKYLYTGEKRTQGRGRQKVYGDKVKWNELVEEAFETMILTDGTVLRSACLYHGGFKRRLRVVVVEKPHCKSTRRCILASSDFEMDAPTIVAAYSARFQIEFVIRDGKGYTGLDNAQTRQAQTIDAHLNCSLLALGIARAQHYQKVGLESKVPFSIDKMKTQEFNEHFAARILSIYGISPELIKNHPEYINISKYAIAQT